MSDKSISWPDGIAAITLFTEQVAETQSFYQRVFDQEPFYVDSTSAVFKFGTTIINLLDITEADELVAPASVAGQSGGCRAVYTLNVVDVDATCNALTARGVELLNGPLDRPWGIRTASFADPAGHIWELSAPLRNA